MTKQYKIKITKDFQKELASILSYIIYVLNNNLITTMRDRAHHKGPVSFLFIIGA